MNNKKYYICLFYTALLAIIYYISGVVGILELILSIIIYIIIFYLLYKIWMRIRKKIEVPFTDFIYYFLYRLSIFITLITLILGSFTYYNNEISPAPMPEITITNGEKTIIFQAMSHIGTQSFYDSIVENIKESKINGYVYFFEGVKPGTEENTEKFNKALGVKFDEELYKNFSKLYGVSNQDNNDFLGLVNDLDFNVDLNLDEIIGYYKENINASEENIPEDIIPIDISKQITEVLLELNEKQLKILVYINKSILNFLIRSTGIQETLTNNFTNKDLFDVILDKRNEVLANEIIKSEYNKIYLTYGLLHFKGVLELLQKDNNNWKIIGEKYYYPIK